MRSVVDLGLALGLGVVAEGIETEVQLEELRALNARTGQGYLFSRPVEAAAFEELVRIDPATHKLYLAGSPTQPAPVEDRVMAGPTPRSGE